MCSPLLLVASLLGSAQAASSRSISFVQASSGPSTLQARNSSVAVSYAKAQTAGDLNVVVVGWGDNTSVISSITDSKGNSYSRAVGPTSTTALQQSIYYAKNIAGGSTTVTVKFNQAAAYPDVRILEYSGVDPSSPLDVTAAATGKGTSASSGSATTTSANELIFGAGNSFDRFTAPGSGWVQRILNVYGNIAEDKIVRSRGSYAATATNSTGSWVMQMVALKARSSGGVGSAPSVSSVSPSSGSSSGGTAVTITGSNFVAGAAVTFGGTAASNVSVVNSTSITATVPAHAAGAVNVVVSDNKGNGTLTNGFTYTAAPPIQHAVALSWTASSSANIQSYNVYRSTISGGYYGLIGSIVGSLAYTDNTVKSGTTYYYVTTAVSNQGQESGYSNQAVAIVPSP